jgi:hypothetical protein
VNPSPLERLLRLALFVLLAAGSLTFVLQARPRTPHLDGAAPPPPRGARVGGRAAATSGAGQVVLDQLAQARAEAQEEQLLLEALGRPHLGTAGRARAEEALLALERSLRQEGAVGQLLAAQGLGPALVTITGGRAVVVVPQARLSPAQLERIGQDLWRLAAIPPQNLVVKPSP